MPLPPFEPVSRSPSSGGSPPLVSCIIVVGDATRFPDAAIRDFQHQTYRHRELLIVGGRSARPDIAGDARVRWIEALPGETEREQIVRGVRAARGAVIAHWSDDWNGPERLTQQVAALESTDALLTGLTRLRYLDPLYREAWDYTYGGKHLWLAHPTWAYRREVVDIEMARSDAPGFVRRLDPDTVHDAGGVPWFVARVPRDHDREKRIRSTWWQRTAIEDMPDKDPRFRRIAGESAKRSLEGETDRDLPLVSCLMPTGNRPRFARQAVRYFQRQTYPNRELVIVDDGEPSGDRTAEGVPLWVSGFDGCETSAPVRYLRVDAGMSIGAKRNAAVRAASGEILLCWDDDDWHGPERIERQVEPIRAGRAGVTAIGQSLFYHVESDQFWRCSAAIHARMFFQQVMGGTLAFRRSDWRQSDGFPDQSMAEDAAFLRRLMAGGVRLERLSGDDLFVYVRHGSNSWRFDTGRHLGQRGWSHASPPSAMTPTDHAFYTRVPIS